MPRKEALAKIDLASLTKMKSIAFPDDTKADAHSLTAKWLEVHSLEIEGSGVSSCGARDGVQAALTKVRRKSNAASNLVRSNPGLPRIHL